MTQRIAFIKSGIVVNIAIASIDFANQYAIEHLIDFVIDVTDTEPAPGIGWQYENNEFIKPEEKPVNYGSWVTQEAYRNRFTFDERKALKTLSATDLDISVLLDDLSAATNGVNLNDPATQQGCGILTTKTYNGQPVLTPARVNEIIGAPVKANEVPPLNPSMRVI